MTSAEAAAAQRIPCHMRDSITLGLAVCVGSPNPALPYTAAAYVLAGSTLHCVPWVAGAAALPVAQFSCNQLHMEGTGQNRWGHHPCTAPTRPIAAPC
jgi:hypothetical protein